MFGYVLYHLTNVDWVTNTWDTSYYGQGVSP